MNEPDVLWTISPTDRPKTNLARYMAWLTPNYGHTFVEYQALWQWSIDQLETFWESLWSYFEVGPTSGYKEVLSDHVMPGARWFNGSALNYAEQALRRLSSSGIAMVSWSEARPRLASFTGAELTREVAALQAGLRRFGIGRGDRVAAYLPNCPEAVIAFLATASLGAIWSCSSPDFGAESVVDRFRQIEPKILIAVDGYRYAGKSFDRLGVVRDIQANLPSVSTTIVVPHLSDTPAIDVMRNTLLWSTAMEYGGVATFDLVPFEWPLWILYTSGTTGLPKPIVHGHGGIVLEHLKFLSFHLDLQAQDRLFWYASTGWVMWNIMVSGLLTGSTIVLYDGSPTSPSLDQLWMFASLARVSVFGTSASYLSACEKSNERPSLKYDLSGLRAVSSTGSPLAPEAFRWVYAACKSDVYLSSVSGGTDVATAFVGSVPIMSVRAGEIQCRCLGVDAVAYDETGAPVVGEMGELVVRQPMPSMPVSLWNDADYARYKASYFSHYPGVWRHGDWITFLASGASIIHGRSDSTVNRNGVRYGTSEIYRVVEHIAEVRDSLVIDLSDAEGGGFVVLFVVLNPGHTLDSELKRAILARIRAALSPRHIPDAIVPAPSVPRTLNGKKLEVPVKRILQGNRIEDTVQVGAVSDPQSLDYFAELARAGGLRRHLVRQLL